MYQRSLYIYTPVLTETISLNFVLLLCNFYTISEVRCTKI